jgi:hypothetical protein
LSFQTSKLSGIMPADFPALAAAAVSIGCIHCLLGPDHYVPFVAMSRAGGWSWRKTILVTALCGVGHVFGSAVLGLVGIGLGAAVFKLETAEAARGDLAAWLLCGFGLAYFTWGVVYAVRKKHRHSHVHVRGDGKWGMTPWILFTIFLFGPCEPLIPLLMYPAAKANGWQVACVTGLFGSATLITMTSMVVLLRWGVQTIHLPRLRQYGHAIAGLVLLACGMAIMLGM